MLPECVCIYGSGIMMGFVICFAMEKKKVIRFISELLQAVAPHSDWSCIFKTFKNEGMQLCGTSSEAGLLTPG